MFFKSVKEPIDKVGEIFLKVEQNSKMMDNRWISKEKFKETKQRRG